VATWPEGHRIEDYTVKILDVNRTWLGDLHTCKGLKGTRSNYGQFRAALTFALESTDPWASVLKQDELHYVSVWRDEEQIWCGYQVKMDRQDQPSQDLRYIEFSFLPLSRVFYWRHGIPVIGDSLYTTDKVDDAFKWFAERTLGATAPVTPDTGLARQLTGFTIAANKSEYPANVLLDATRQNMYEFLNQWGYKYEVDWDVRFDAAWNMEFETWYPRRGLDRTEGNGDGNVEMVFSDAWGQITKQRYGWDTADLATCIISKDGSHDVAAAAGLRANWLFREMLLDTQNPIEMGVALADHNVKEFYEMGDFVETEDMQWLPTETPSATSHTFDVGDKISWFSTRLGYGTEDGLLAAVEFSIDDDGFEHLKLTIGEPEPDDVQRGGNYRRPAYTAPLYALLWGDAHTIVHPGLDDAIGIEGGTAIDVNEFPASFKLVVSHAADATAIPDAHHNTVTISADADTNLLSLTVQQIGLDDQLANTVFAGPIAGGAACPTFRALVSADMPADVMKTGDFVAPTITFGAAHAAGIADTMIRSDATIQLQVAGDAGTATFGAAGNTLNIVGAGDVTTAGDGANTITITCTNPPAAMPALTFALANALGGSGSFINTNAAIQLQVAGDANVATFGAAGNTLNIVGAGDVTTAGDGTNTITITCTNPTVPAFAAPTVTFGAAAVEGIATTVMRSDATLQLQVAGDASSATFGAAGNTLNIVGAGGTSTAGDGANTITITSTDAFCNWQRTTGPPNYLHQTVHGDELRLYNVADGLTFKIDSATGDVTGCELALGTPYLLFSITDYDMIDSARAGTAGVHDVCFSGNLWSQADTTPSIIAFLGGSAAPAGEDLLQARNLTCYDSYSASAANTFFDLTVANGLRLWKAMDLELWDGAMGAGAKTITLDGGAGTIVTTSNITAGGDLKATGGQVYLADANSYLENDGTYVQIKTNKTYVGLHPGGANCVWVGSGIGVYPATDNSISSGKVDRRWAAEYAMQYNVVDANNYIGISGPVFGNWANTIWAAYSAGVARLVVKGAVVRRGSAAECDLGDSTYPWQNAYIKKLYDGDNNAYYADLASAGTSINAAGNIVTAGVVNPTTGFQIGGVATSGSVLMGNGTNIVLAAQSSIDHGALDGKGDDDHTQYLLADGTRALTGAWDAGSYEIRAGTIVTTAGVTFNESGADSDTRIEGDTDANLLFVDAGTDRVGIGTGAPGYKFHVIGSCGGGAFGYPFVLEMSDCTSGIYVAGFTGAIGNATDGDTLLNSGGNFIIAPGTGHDILLVGGAWNNAVSMTIKDGGNVGIGTTTPSTELDVDGVINATTGYRVNGSGAAGSVLVGNGTNIVLEAAPFVRRDGSLELSANWDAGGYNIRSLTFQSDVATGTAPFTVASTTVVGNLNASYVGGKGEGAFVLIDGMRPLTGNWDAGSYNIRAQTLQSDVATGTAPLTVASTTMVSNLNANYLGGYAQDVNSTGFTIMRRDASQYVYAVAYMDPTSTYYLAPALNTSLVIAGSITMAAGKTVDGVDVSVLKSDYDAHNHGGATGDWSTSGYAAGGRGWGIVYSDTGMGTQIGVFQLTGHEHPISTP